jgi:hypothetical protein
MTIPTTKIIPVVNLWRIVCWQGERQEYTQRVIKNWLVSRVPTPDGVTFEIGAEWTSPPGVEFDDDTAALIPMTLLPPGDVTTVDEVAEAHAAGRGDRLPYAVSPFGFTGAVRRAVEGGDDRLKHLLDLGQRLVLAHRMEAGLIAEKQPNPETATTAETCPLCGLRFRDVWILGTHRGSAHRVARPTCDICGTQRCDGPIGRVIHQGIVTEEESASGV